MPYTKAMDFSRTLLPALVLLLGALAVHSGAASAGSVPAQRKGPWLGESPPDTTPALFAPGTVSTGMYERDTAWTPDGRELYWTVFAPLSQRGTIVTVRMSADGVWSEPFIFEMFPGFSSLEPFVTTDGKWLWFASNRPLPGETEPGDWNLWRAPREGDVWGAPEPLPAPINLEGDEFYPSLTRDGTVYFTAERDGGHGGEDIWRSRPTSEGWSAAENLGPGVNSEGPEFNALVQPDGKWILFGSVRKGDQGGGDLYFSRRRTDGSWGRAVALPAPLNSKALDFCPSLSPDGRFLFFSSRRETPGPLPTAFDALSRALLSAGNGQSDVYWVSASALPADESSP